MMHHIGMLQLLAVCGIAGGMLAVITYAWVYHAIRGIIRHRRAGR